MFLPPFLLPEKIRVPREALRITLKNWFLQKRTPWRLCVSASLREPHKIGK